MSGEARRVASNRESRPEADDAARGFATSPRTAYASGLHAYRAPFVRRAWPLILLALTLFGVAFGSDAHAQNIADAYIDLRGNVVVVGRDGRLTMVTAKGGCGQIVVAKDRRAVAWSKSTRRGSAVFIYRDGVVRKIEGSPFVRDYWFVDGGRKIAVAHGGLYFAGWESLYDVATWKLIDEFNQTTTPMESRPGWSTSSEVYSGD